MKEREELVEALASTIMARRVTALTPVTKATGFPWIWAKLTMAAASTLTTVSTARETQKVLSEAPTNASGSSMADIALSSLTVR